MSALSKRQDIELKHFHNTSPVWRIVWGIMLIFVGILAVLAPSIAAFTTVFVFAWLLILGGIFELAHTFQRTDENSFAWMFTVSCITLIFGITILLAPLTGVASFAILVGSFLFGGGIARTMLAFSLYHTKGWGWVLLDGLLGIGLSLLIAFSWPKSSLAIIGMLTGFSLISAGVWRILLARTTNSSYQLLTQTPP